MFVHFNLSIIVITIFCLKIIQIDCQRTYLDEKYLDNYRSLRNRVFNYIGRTDDEFSYEWNLKRGKVQQPFPDNHRFFCDPNGPGGRSEITPNSVHQLRPGDIDIIGAIGDSLTAGNGGLATNILQILIENRGISWSIGGQENWKKFLTLPNILKEFNPNLYGYSMADGFSINKNASMFNIAEIGAMSRDLPKEADLLIQRMEMDSSVNITHHWKLITIMIGANDFCSDMCYRLIPNNILREHELDLIKTLRILRDNLPRTIINLVTPPNVTVLVELLNKPLECQTIHHIECPCLFGFAYRNQRTQFFNIINKWQLVVEKVADMSEFHDRNDFTVINQPFIKSTRIPKTSTGQDDYTYMSLDCFHLSQKAYARATNGLWNNMFEPYGKKTTAWTKEFTVFKCPTKEMPFICTKKNC